MPHPIIDDYWAMVLADINGALDVSPRSTRRATASTVTSSVEVAPEPRPRRQLARSAAARELHERVDRQNVMIKIPATAEGVPAIRQMIAEGRSINVTLIFSLERYAEVMEAYISGLEEYAEQTPDADLSKVASVASFFISRVDTEVDRRLDAEGSTEALELRGTRRGRTGEVGLPTVHRDVLRAPLGGAGALGAASPTPAVGVDVDQEPCLSRTRSMSMS